MPINTACRRLTVLNSILKKRNFLENKVGILTLNYCTGKTQYDLDKGETSVTIGDVKKVIIPTKNPEYVPRQYLLDNLDQDTLHNLRWMLQKDLLGQDMFLIGRPGPMKRRLAMQFLELTGRESEFVSLSRDTTESDLKQRREIQASTAKYIDQSAVRAALKGRVLILEGIEKAERNVLPVLNNLLENREMNLEDGRFLIHPKQYDKLLEKHGPEELARWKVNRVSEQFRVIALGLPVPGYQGNPLDPPLRSRFQARDVTPPLYHEVLRALREWHREIDESRLAQLVSCGYGLMSPEAAQLGLPDFPLDTLPQAASILERFPWVSVWEVVARLYPGDSMLKKEGVASVDGLLRKFTTPPTDLRKGSCRVLSAARLTGSTASVRLTSLGLENTVTVPCGSLELNRELSDLVRTDYQESVLGELVESHSVGDLCLIGPKGCGKSSAAIRLAALLGYTLEPVVLYRDMSARELVQQRTTLDNGDTVWKLSPLVQAALEGNIALLDGLHRLHPTTLSVLHRLVHDRELQLHDGQRLLRHDRYDLLAAELGEEALRSAGILRVHPSFRILALAEPPAPGVTPWLNPELLSMFLYHEMRPLQAGEETHIITSLLGQMPRSVSRVLEVSQILQNSGDATLQSLGGSLTTRQLLRMARRAITFQEQDPHTLIFNACLAKFLPPLAKNALETVLVRNGIMKGEERKVRMEGARTIEVDERCVTIGQTSAPLYQTSTSSSSMVPNILFHQFPQAVAVLENLLQDFLLGEHLLLVGNQGVGKNKYVDKLLQLLNRPREYIQLHRDTTVQSLTLQPSLRDGRVTYEDSPLVTAVKCGYVLVVDEADKAPTHVTCILKTLVENGEMVLSDGRRIVAATDPRVGQPNIIPTHPDFRMMVLANRPGFPFLGNDFFGALGDLFSCHAIDNPTMEDEMVLLRSYGPEVSEPTLRRLVLAFRHLRSLADEGLVAYPYSLRELVNIVKHLQAFPEDTLSEGVGNVFDFDRYSKDARDTLMEVLSKYGIPVAMTPEGRVASRKNVQLTIEKDSGLKTSGPKHGKEDDKNEPHVGGNTWAGGTGGRDTAGLGGKGGPYRLDAGHDIHQISDAEKAAVPEHIKRAAKEMGEEAFKKRLEEIRMSTYDAKLYGTFSSAVSKQVQALRVMLSSLQAKSKERQWAKHQVSGELDDTKLIEGLTGEKNIYRRRAEIEPEMGSPQLKPKRLRLVVDVSGSMYRFNGYDGRLDRELEAVVMLMEAMEGFESRFEYDVVGHSGESPRVVFVEKGRAPSDNNQRLQILKTMHAHAQYCWAGDYTLEATEEAVRSLAMEDCDEAIVIVLSDANLARYAISPKKLSESLSADPRVEAYAIFIGSLGNEAEKLCSALPAGKGFTCFDTAQLPNILQNIFASSMLKNSS